MKYRLEDDKFYAQIIERNGKLKKSDVQATVEAICEVVFAYCTDGVGVNIPGLVEITPMAKGTQDAKGEWISGPHKRLRVRMAKSLREKFEVEATIEQIKPSKIEPEIDAIIDMNTGSINSNLTIGNGVAIVGRNLKGHLLMEDEGVFFVKEDGTAVRSLRYPDYLPGRISCQIPAELEGETTCTLEVRVRIKSNKVLRTTAFKRVLNLV